MWLRKVGHRLVRSQAVLVFAVSNMLVSGVATALVVLAAGLSTGWCWSYPDLTSLHLMMLVRSLLYSTIGTAAYSGAFCNYKCEKHLTAQDRKKAGRYFAFVIFIDAVLLLCFVFHLYDLVHFRRCVSARSWLPLDLAGVCCASSEPNLYRAYVNFGWMYFLIYGICLANALFSIVLSVIIRHKMGTKTSTVVGAKDNENGGTDITEKDISTVKNPGMDDLVDSKDPRGRLLCTECETERKTRCKENQSQNLPEVKELLASEQAAAAEA
ncbi:uncharacterized protein LOC129601773 [Paramacrobiotus metropolitanus]|uniref:uncharacterized protein LOC129601773 n=1 Tax=Paramacrobiotus metropolitanus TaxID=2943436 RepID=UPI0024465842|nr:uncharacterized protein LOC129601773 [Paramacrobiotus metropolitanus]